MKPFESTHGLGGPRVKAGFHCHSLKSDGGLSPQETIEVYRSKGFDCLGITDHFLVTDPGTSPNRGMVVIPSTENGGKPDIIGVGVSAPVDEDLALAERAELLTAQGGFTIAAHPAYCAVLPDAYVGCEGLQAMEIYNAYCDMAYTNGYALELWDMVLGSGKRIWGVAGDDAHLNPGKRFFSEAGLGWVEIWTEISGEREILAALKEGRFFSTQGPVFDSIEVEGGAIRVRCGPVREVRWRTYGKVGFVDYSAKTGELTESHLPDWFEPNIYVRIEMVDARGKRGWSNPIFVGG